MLLISANFAEIIKIKRNPESEFKKFESLKSGNKKL